MIAIGRAHLDAVPASAARWLAGLLLALPLTAAAQVAPPLPEERLSLERYGLDEGLSQLAVTAMDNDDRGFLWIATQEGLNRFDGHRFRTFRSAPDAAADGGHQDDGSNDLLSSSIDSLAFEQHSGRLWLGTNDAGLEVVDLHDWHHARLGPAQGLSHPRVTQVLLDPAGGAWLGTEKGIDHVDAAVSQVEHVGTTAAVAGLAWSPIVARPVALDEQCRLWTVAGTALQPLPRLPAAGCVALQAGPEGLWVLAAQGGLFQLDASGRVQRQWDRDALQTDAPPSAMIRLQDGRILLGFADGEVLELRAAGRELWRLRFDRPLGSAITSFHQDSGGSWWIGTYTSGLSRVRPLSSVILSDALGVGAMVDWPSRSVRAIWRDSSHVLIGTDDGLMLRTGGGGGWRALAPLRGRSVRAIRTDPQGGWWLGTLDGLFHLSADGAIEPYPGLPDPRVDDLLADAGGLLVATRSGLMALRDGRLVPERRAAALDGRMITTLYRDRDGSVWIGTNDAGLWRMAGDAAATQVQPDGDGMHKSVWAIHGDAEAVWAGTFSAGLFRIDRRSGASQRITDRDGLSNNVVYRILQDDEGRLWLSTNNGISVYDRARGIHQNLGRRDGLHNQEFNSGAALRDARGRLYFGGTQGLDVLSPQHLPRRSPPARPVLTGLQMLGGAPAADVPAHNDIVYADEIQLPNEDSVFTIDMTAIDFLAPAAAQLRYRVRGLNDAWIYPHQARLEFSLNHMPAGDYLLEVQAAGRDGQFGPSRELRIDVPPPWWRHPLAYAGYALLALLGASYLVRRLRARIQHERAQIDLLNRTVAERTAQLRSANSQLLDSNAQLRQATRTDPLTHAYNRRELQDRMGEESPRLLAELDAARTPELPYFFMLDIDHFKRVNDSYGHQAGDGVLVAVASRLRALCREHDLLVRWGGEEFLLVARFANARDAAGLAERMRASIGTHPVGLGDGLTLEVTCSLGFAPWPLSPQWPGLGDWEQSVALADRCLYAAKAGGRDAWVGVAAATAADRTALQAVLAGADPTGFGDAIVCLHSLPQPPPFAH